MQSFHKRVNKLLKTPSLNEKDYTNNVDVVSKQQFQKIKEQKIKKIKQRKIQNNKYFLMKNYQNIIKKFNNNLLLLRNILLQNIKLADLMKNNGKIKQKTQKLDDIKQCLIDVKSLTIFLDDIDKEVLQKDANKG